MGDLKLKTEISFTISAACKQAAPVLPPLPTVEGEEKNEHSPWEQKVTLAQAAALEECANHKAGKLPAHGESRKT